MLVVMMAIIVCVRMLVNRGFMDVMMVVLFVDQEYRTRHHKWNGKQEEQADRFFEQEKRQG